MIKSNLDMEEVVENTERKFGSNLEYYPCLINKEIVALFTEHEIEIAMKRAARNPEDIHEDISFWNFLFGKTRRQCD